MIYHHNPTIYHMSFYSFNKITYFYLFHYNKILHNDSGIYFLFQNFFYFKHQICNYNC